MTSPMTLHGAGRKWMSSQKRGLLLVTLFMLTSLHLAVARDLQTSSLAPPNLDALPPGEQASQIRFGRDVFARTFAYVGPEVSDPLKRFAGNNLSCNNCHLNGGVTSGAFPLVGYATSLATAGDKNVDATIDTRVNQCMTRSMAGDEMPVNTPELRALTSYIVFLSSTTPAGANVVDSGAVILSAPLGQDPAAGANLYQMQCAECHGVNGQGVRAGAVGDGRGYAVPPLWGPDSFAADAGLARVETLAHFIFNNMPPGNTYASRGLSREDAWGNAAFVARQPRPSGAPRK